MELRNMNSAQRTAHREFWLAWVERAQQALGALLAETIGETPSASDTVYGCVNQLIDVEQQLAAVLDPERPFKWSRHPDGSWSSNDYQIKRERTSAKWRVLRGGEFWDAIEKLPEAKLVCERDFTRRRKVREQHDVKREESKP